MTEQEAKQLEVDMEWNGRANVCVHCGRVPETFYIVTGHNHTDDEIRWCLCRKPITPKKSMDNEDQAYRREHVIRLLELSPECLALRLEQIQDTIQRLHVCDLHLSQTAWVHFNKLQEQIKALQ